MKWKQGLSEFEEMEQAFDGSEWPSLGDLQDTARKKPRRRDNVPLDELFDVDDLDAFLRDVE